LCDAVADQFGFWVQPAELRGDVFGDDDPCATGELVAITFWKFTKYGIVVTVWSAALAWAYMWLRYF
jgi:hypothetical protein